MNFFKRQARIVLGFGERGAVVRAVDVHRADDIEQARALLRAVDARPGGAGAIAVRAALAGPRDDEALSDPNEVVARSIADGKLVVVELEDVLGDATPALVASSDVRRVWGFHARGLLVRASEDHGSVREILALARALAPWPELEFDEAIDIVAERLDAGSYVVVCLADDLARFVPTLDADPSRVRPEPIRLSDLLPKESGEDVTWVEFRVIDQFEQPMPKMLPSLARPDRQRSEGPLDEEARLRVDPLRVAGTCELDLRMPRQQKAKPR